MPISVQIQSVVAAGRLFAVGLEPNGGSKKGVLTLTVGNQPRKFALDEGGPLAESHEVFVDEPQARDLFDWGTPEDAGKKLVVTVTSGADKQSDDIVVTP